MGYSSMQTVKEVLHDRTLTIHEKMVMICLAQHADENGQCFPSVRTIATLCSISRPTAIKALRSLEQKGWIVSEKQNGKVARYALNQSTTLTGQRDLPVNQIDHQPVNHVDHRSTTFTGQPDLPVNDVDHTGKPDLPVSKQPVNDVYRTGQRGLPELNKNNVVNNVVDVYNVVNDAGDENFQKVAQHFLQRKGKGLWLSPLDEQEIHDLLAEGIPVDVIIQGIDRAFEQYRPKFRGDEISSFRYCAKVVRRLWAERKAEKNGGKVVPLKAETQPRPPYWEKFDEEKYRQQCEEAQRRAEELGIDLAWQAKMLEKKFGHLPTPKWLQPYVDRIKKEMEQQSVGS